MVDIKAIRVRSSRDITHSIKNGTWDGVDGLIGPCIQAYRDRFALLAECKRLSEGWREANISAEYYGKGRPSDD